MKATGIVRRVDQLGRIVLPKQLRRDFGIDPGTPLEMYVEGQQVIVQKYEQKCVFCGEPADQELKGKIVCGKCMKELNSEF